jgi:hypothetical protein
MHTKEFCSLKTIKHILQQERSVYRGPSLFFKSIGKRFPGLAQGVAILSIHVAWLEITVGFIMLWLVHKNILLRVFLL